MIIAIVGTTASGKSDLGLYLAKKYRGEIICADSCTIYRGMDIGTAKPSAKAQREVRHHLLDVIDPTEKLGAAEFKRLAAVAEAEIISRGNIPFLVGGSGMYVDAILYDYEFPKASNPDSRSILENLSTKELCAKLKETDLEAYQNIDLHNTRRVIRAIETAGLERAKRSSVRDDALVLGLTLNKEVVQKRIHERIVKMLREGFIDEVKFIGNKYGWDSEAMNVTGYRAFKDVIFGEKSVEEGTAEFAKGDMLIFKKQLTWFKRNRQINWLNGDVRDMADALVSKFCEV